MAFVQYPQGASADAALRAGVIQWVDFAASGGWFCRAQELSRPAEIARLDLQPWRVQYAALRDALTALSNGYRWLSLPPEADPIWRPECANVFASDGAIRRMGIALDSMGFHEFEGDVSAASYGASVEGGPIFYWALLDDNARPVYRCQMNDPGSGHATPDPTRCVSEADPRQGFDGIYAGCGRIGKREQGCDPFDWSVVSWSHQPASGLEILAPPRWTMELIQRVAAQCVARGPEGLLLQAKAWVVANNLALMVRLGVPDAAALYAEIARINSADVTSAEYASGTAYVRTAGAAASLVPVYGQAAGAALGATADIADLFNHRGLSDREQVHMLRGFVDGAEGLTAPPTVAPPPAPRAGDCAADPVPGPRVAYAWGQGAEPCPAAALCVSLFDMPRGWTTARVEAWPFGGLSADVAQIRQTVTAPAVSATVLGLPTSRPTQLRAVVKTPYGEYATPYVTVAAAPGDTPDPAALRDQVGTDCRRWAGLPRAEKLRLLTTLTELRGAAQQRALTALDADCFATVTRSGVDIVPTPPVLRTVGVTLGGLAPLPVTGPALWAALRLGCSEWGALDDTQRDAALTRIGLTTPALRDGAKATLALACTPLSLDDGRGWLDRMSMTCAAWKAMTPSGRGKSLEDRGVVSAPDRNRVVAAVAAACAAPPATSPADRARSVILRNVLTCAAWAGMSPAARAGLAATPETPAADVPAVVAAVTTALGACAAAAPGAATAPAAGGVPTVVKGGLLLALLAGAAKVYRDRAARP